MQAVPLPYDQVSFQRDGVELTRAHFGPTLKRPFLYPVIGPSGKTLTRMGHPQDPIGHSHHNSVWLSHTKVNGVDFWGDKGKGRIVHQQLEKLTDSDASCSATMLNAWVDEASQKPLLLERRRITVQPLEKDEWLLTIDSQFEAKVDVVFDKTPFGFLGTRMAKTIGVRDGGGRILNSAGAINEKGLKGDDGVFWKPAKWVDYSGPTVNDKTIEGITILDHPKNPNHPSVFHVRDDGWMGSSFSFADPVKLAAGESLRVRYGLYVQAGASAETIDRRWAEFAKTELDDLSPKKPKAASALPPEKGKGLAEESRDFQVHIDGPKEAIAGEPQTYTITAFNKSDRPINKLFATIVWSPDLEATAANPDLLIDAANKNFRAWPSTPITLPPGATRTLTVTLRSRERGQHFVRAKFAGTFSNDPKDARSIEANDEIRTSFKAP